MVQILFSPTNLKFTFIKFIFVHYIYYRRDYNSKDEDRLTCLDRSCCKDGLLWSCKASLSAKPRWEKKSTKTKTEMVWSGMGKMAAICVFRWRGLCQHDKIRSAMMMIIMYIWWEIFILTFPNHCNVNHMCASRLIGCNNIIIGSYNFTVVAEGCAAAPSYGTNVWRG